MKKSVVLCAAFAVSASYAKDLNSCLRHAAQEWNSGNPMPEYKP